jgi:ribosome-associated protein
MTPEQIRDLAIAALEDLKAVDLTVIDVKSLTDITDYMIICSGNSTRHVKSLAENVASKAKAAQIKPVRMEGEKQSEWVLVDLNDVVIHVMLPAARAFYSLEALWEPIKEMRVNSTNS